MRAKSVGSRFSSKSFGRTCRVRYSVDREKSCRIRHCAAGSWWMSDKDCKAMQRRSLCCCRCRMTGPSSSDCCCRPMPKVECNRRDDK